jgi:DNA-binding CsgD family transcriptional regulator
VPLEEVLLEISARPRYQRVAQKAVDLRELGLSNRTIARKLGVDDKTVAKAIRWLRRMQS